MENRNKLEKILSLPIAIIIAGAMLSGAWMYNTRLKISDSPRKISIASENIREKSVLEEKVLPTAGVTLPITWGDLSKKLVSVGVIDGEKFKALYTNRGQFTEEYQKLLSGDNKEKLKITEENAGYLLNLFWALGLSNGNPILDSGEMADKAYGGAGNFASTGGWTMAVGNPMDHYSRHMFFNLTPEQQALVDKMSRGIYRPCCDNSTHFPDCNHGIAMLGLLELMASQSVSEQDMWKMALTVNSYWFPDTYLTIATYMKEKKSVDWQNVNSQEMLSMSYSSASGYAKIASQVIAPSSSKSGNGCGVDVRPQSGCGI